MNCKISIIMPAYNAENKISDSIESVIKQSYKNWELIIIDDKSTDDTIDVVNFFSNKDSRVVILKNQTNLGVSKTRNKGIEYAKSKYIAFLDSDDIWQKDKLKEQVNFIKKGYNFIFSGAKYINENGIAYPGSFIPREKTTYEKLLYQNVISTSSVLLSKKILGNKRFGDDTLHEDFELWLKILKEGNVAYCVQNPLITYRLYRDSKSGNKIKSINMTFGVYRNLNFGLMPSCFYTCSHLINASLKYKRILK